MQTAAVIALAAFLVVHGLIHLIGMAVYMKLGKVDGLPYKTTLIGGRWELGEAGMKVFGALWVVPALGFVGAAAALGFDWVWWKPLLLGVILLSLCLTVLDWSGAYAGAIVNVLILAGVLLGPAVLSRLGWHG